MEQGLTASAPFLRKKKGLTTYAENPFCEHEKHSLTHSTGKPGLACLVAGNLTHSACRCANFGWLGCGLTGRRRYPRRGKSQQGNRKAPKERMGSTIRWNHTTAMTQHLLRKTLCVPSLQSGGSNLSGGLRHPETILPRLPQKSTQIFAIKRKSTTSSRCGQINEIPKKPSIFGLYSVEILCHLWYNTVKHWKEETP